LRSAHHRYLRQPDRSEPPHHQAWRASFANETRVLYAQPFVNVLRLSGRRAQGRGDRAIAPIHGCLPGTFVYTGQCRPTVRRAVKSALASHWRTSSKFSAGLNPATVSSSTNYYGSQTRSKLGSPPRCATSPQYHPSSGIQAPARTRSLMRRQPTPAGEPAPSRHRLSPRPPPPCSLPPGRVQTPKWADLQTWETQNRLTDSGWHGTHKASVSTSVLPRESKSVQTAKSPSRAFILPALWRPIAIVHLSPIPCCLGLLAYRLFLPVLGPCPSRHPTIQCSLLSPRRQPPTS